MASVVDYITTYSFSRELRLTTFYHLGFILETDHLLLGSKLTDNVLRRSVDKDMGMQIPCK